MRKQILILITLFQIFNCFSQISFQNGYFINNSNEKVDCLIKKNNSKNNPTELEYKLTENGSVEKLSIKYVLEFGIPNQSKYIRKSVAIDNSTNTVNSLKYDRNPTYENEELFLDVLVEGKANLYVFESGNLRKYFYSTEKLPITQLIYKQYINPDGKIKANDDFKRQLWSNLNCHNISEAYTTNLTYKKSELINYFTKYNECENSEFTIFKDNENLILFNLTLRPGINSSSLITHLYNKEYYDVNFSSKLNMRFGLEAEFIIKSPNKNNWAILFEPTYQYYKSEIEVVRLSSNFTTKADYKSIELPVGIRYYLSITDDSKIFFNGSFVLDFPMNSNITSNFEEDFQFKSGNNFAFGVGYKFVDKYSLELRYLTSRNTLFNYLTRDSDYKTVSAIFGYTIF